MGYHLEVNREGSGKYLRSCGSKIVFSLIRGYQSKRQERRAVNAATTPKRAEFVGTKYKIMIPMTRKSDETTVATSDTNGYTRLVSFASS